MTISKFSVRWVYQKKESGQKPSLCFRGHKHALCVGAGYPVRVFKRPVAEFDRYRLVQEIPEFNGSVPKGAQPPGQHPYPIAKAVAQLQALAAKNGVTAGAARLLERAALQQNGIDEDDYHDEEETTMANEDPTPVGTTTPTSTKETPVKSTKKTAKAKVSKTAKKTAKAKAPRTTKGSKCPSTFSTGEFREGSASAKGTKSTRTP